MFTGKTMLLFIVVKARKDEYRSTSQRFTLSFNVCQSRQMDV